ncbi:MAG: lysylphosphatidylglycerol synthase domain-containing protein [Candidatus Omnitrophota bacterium]
MSILLIAATLLCISLVTALCFYLLAGRKITFKEAFKLSSTATALNRLFFTGSGYLASSYFARAKNIPFGQTLSAFAVLEFINVSPWLCFGFYFGAKLTFKIPFVIPLLLVLFAVTAWLKKSKIFYAVKKVTAHLKKTGRKILFIIPFAVINMLLYLIYYTLIFKTFHFSTSLLNILKITSLSLTVGYLSFMPAGLGFKETTLVMLLKDNGVILNHAVNIAIADRVCYTLFWAILGLIVGFDLIRESVKSVYRKISAAK